MVKLYTVAGAQSIQQSTDTEQQGASDNAAIATTEGQVVARNPGTQSRKAGEEKAQVQAGATTNPTPWNATEMPPEVYRRPNAVIEPRAGQIWCDCYEGNGPRYLLIEEVSLNYVGCSTLRTGKQTVIRRNRLKPGSRGYRYVGDLPELDLAVSQLHEFWIRRAVKRAHERQRRSDRGLAHPMAPIGNIAAAVNAEAAG